MLDSLYTDLRPLCADTRRGELLSAHTTVRVGGPARVTAFPRDARELETLLAGATGHGVELTVVGGGANLFADSAGFDGLVVNMTRWRPEISIADDGLLMAGGGARLSDVAREAAQRGWGGVDFMGEVPGTLGGAVVINAGTNVGGYVADRFEWAETLTLAGERRRVTGAEMAFEYRATRLLHADEIVLRAAFRLARCENLGLAPEDIIKRFDSVMADRASKFPLDLPNFGSTFRSPGRPHPPAGKLIDDLGLKGLRSGDAQISETHGNFIVNRGAATSGDVLTLMQRMRDAVEIHHGVRLEPEVHYLCNRGRPRPAFFPGKRPAIL